MTLFKYDEYINMIPYETKCFVEKLLSYLADSDYINGTPKSIFDKTDKLFCKALCTLRKQGETEKSILKLLGFTKEFEISSHSLTSTEKVELFSLYYEALTPFSHKEEYINLTPVDIIANIATKLMKEKDSEYNTLEYISSSKKEFIKKLVELTAQAKKAKINEISGAYNKNYSISTINYLDMVGKVFIYLRDNAESIKGIDVNNDILRNMAMIIAIFLYKHISEYKNAYDEQQLIIDFLGKRGITLDAIKQTLGLTFDEKIIEQADSTLVLKRYFDTFSSNNHSSSYTVGNIVDGVLENGIGDSLPMRKILGLFDVSIKEVDGLSEELKNHFDQLSNMTIFDLYKGLLPNVIAYIRRVSQIYTYLISKRDTLDPNLLPNDHDLYTLAVLLSSYELDNNLSKFLTDKGLTIDVILKLVNLPALDIYHKELSEIIPDEASISKYYRLIAEGVNQNVRKDVITIDSIIVNIESKDRTKSELIHKLYRNVTSEKLEDNFEKQVTNHINKNEEQRKKDIAEKLLKDVSIDVYNFLKVLCSYFTIIRKLKIDLVDAIQLSIILAADRYNSNIHDYLSDLDITRTNLSKGFNIDFSYDDKPFDIDIITAYFEPYIFDRPSDQISVYTIFENAFKPELTNSLKLRQVLNRHNKKPEDFIGIEAQIETHKVYKEQKRVTDKYYNVINNINDEIIPLIEDALRIYEYLKTNPKTSKLLREAKDYLKASLVISLLLHDKDYLPFFTQNGITLDVVLNSLGLPKEMLNKLTEITVSEDTLDFYTKFRNNEHYYRTGNSSDKLNIDYLIAALFNPDVTSSKLLEEITTSIGSDYKTLKDEVTNKKDKPITPEEGIEILSKEEATEITDLSYTGISSYGSSISKHSKYINDSLQSIVFADSLKHSLDQINALLGEVTYEEKPDAPKKVSLLERLFGTEEPAKTIVKFDPTKIGDIQEQIDEQIIILTEELRKYEGLKKYIEMYLKLLYDYLAHLKKCYASLDFGPIDPNADEITLFTKSLDQKSARTIIENKISTFETIILLMKQELVTVHNAIINHFLTINSLQTSKTAILPLIVTEMTLSVGKETEHDALELTTTLVNLLGSVVNKNVEATKANLERLRLSSISEETYQSLSAEINTYLISADRGTKLIQGSTPEHEGQTKKKNI